MVKFPEVMMQLFMCKLFLSSSVKEARKGFFGCYSVCETMKDTKEGYFIM